ncbi:hypothetical protein ASPWEDRAFT_151016, partial [Aspergillus wentii DTO 134E9]
EKKSLVETVRLLIIPLIYFFGLFVRYSLPFFSSLVNCSFVAVLLSRIYHLC